MKKNILIAHGGGPTPVINSSLQGVIEGAREAGAGKIFGARFGAEGILKNDLIDLTDIPAGEVKKLRNTPASAIGSCRLKLNESHLPGILDCVEKNHIDCVLYNGGNDSMDTCNKLHELTRARGLDVAVIGVPKTIDNDLAVTDHSPGFGSAARYAAISAAELALDASALPIHVVVMELMGRNAGWITAAASIATRLTDCPMMVCLPEAPLEKTHFLDTVAKQYGRGKGLLVAVSEGITWADGSMLADSGIVDGFGHKVPGGTAKCLADTILRDLGIKARDEKPGLLGRTSMPYVSAVDREEAYGVGDFAVKAALSGKSGCMVSLHAVREGGYRSSMELVPLDQVANVEKKFPAEWIVENGYGVKDAFADYCLPLIGGGLPAFAHFR